MSSSEAAPANVRVLVRVRPLNEREGKTSVLEIDNDGMTPSIDFGMINNGDEDSTNNTLSKSNNSEGTVSIVEHGGYGSGYDSGANTAAAALSASAGATKSFTYDAVFGPQSQQSQIFDSVKGIVGAVCAGYNGTIVAYGQTVSQLFLLTYNVHSRAVVGVVILNLILTNSPFVSHLLHSGFWKNSYNLWRGRIVSSLNHRLLLF